MAHEVYQWNQDPNTSRFLVEGMAKRINTDENSLGNFKQRRFYIKEGFKKISGTRCTIGTRANHISLPGERLCGRGTAFFKREPTFPLGDPAFPRTTTRFLCDE
jgi:hypothetical protein